MTKLVQQVGVTSSELTTLVAPDRVVMVDTDNKDLVIHDGTTPGGHRVPNRNNNDERYLRVDLEVDGGPVDPDARGILVRTGAGLYGLRQIEGAGIDVSNPDGFGGNITISLADEIPGNHQIHGAIGADDGFYGPSFGVHTGNVDVRSHTIQFDDNQIPLSKVAGIAGIVIVPIGGIILWSGSVGSIPANWHLCDGGVGTPDLRDRFLVGAGNGYSVGLTGGSITPGVAVANHTLTTAEMPVHSHSYTDPGHYHTPSDPGHTHAVYDPSHYHSVATNNPATGSVLGGPNPIDGFIGSSYTSAEVTGVSLYAAYTGISIGGSAIGISIANAGSGGAHSHTAAISDGRPPYYALAYIMRIS